MADIQVFKYTGENHQDYSLKLFNATIKEAKTWTELVAAVTIKYFTQLNIYDEMDAEHFKVFHRGYLQRALGAGIEFIETFGSLEVLKHVPPAPKDKLCITVPNNLRERSERLKSVARIKCGASKPDVLAGHDKFIDTREMVRFQRLKIGQIQKSITLYMILTYKMILGIDPSCGEFADRFNNYGISAMLAAKWDQENSAVGAILHEIREQLKDEIAKETGLKNHNIEAIWEWLPFKILEKDKAGVQRWKCKGSDPQKADLQKMYLTNLKTDPTLAMCAFARGMMNYILGMQEFVASNDSKWPGNTDNEKIKKVGANVTESQENPMFRMCKVTKDKLVILMNNELYKELVAIRGTSKYVESGAYTHYIDELLSYKIIPIDTLPYGLVKMGSLDRYNDWTLYDKMLTDTIGEYDYTRWTGHRAFVFGIREHVGFKSIRWHGLYVNPNVMMKMTNPADGVVNWA